MTGPARFGDFAEAARGHLAALPAGGDRPNPDIVARHVRDYTHGLHRILRVMIRYTADLAGSPQLMADPGTGPADGWTQAAAEACRALQEAYRYSPLLRAPRRVREVRRTSPLSRQLVAVAEAMVIGRDLLETHFTAGVDGVPVPRTEWSAVIDSAAVRRALLTELGSWTREIAARTTSLTIAPTMNTAHADIDQQRLTAMHRGLADAAAAIETAHDHAPIHQQDLVQLHAIPVSIPSPRQQPTAAETIAGLCQGITSTAERVRRAFAATASEAAWSPELTAASLRQTAADYTRVRTAAQAGRLLTPVETLYASQDPFLFTNVSRYQATSLLQAYRDAGTTSVQAHATTSQTADQTHDHTLRIAEREHAKAAKAASSQIPGRRSKRKPDLRSPAGRAELLAGREMPGPVERKLLELGVTNPESLARGKEVDQAASQLIDQAAQETASLRWNAAVTSRRTIVNANELVDDILARNQRERAAPSVTQAAGGGRSEPNVEVGSWQAEP